MTDYGEGLAKAPAGTNGRMVCLFPQLGIQEEHIFVDSRRMVMNSGLNMLHLECLWEMLSKQLAPQVWSWKWKCEHW